MGFEPMTFRTPMDAPFRVLVAQLVEHPPGVRKVMGSNPIEDSDFFPEFMYVSTILLKHKQPTYSNRCITIITVTTTVTVVIVK